MTAQPFSRSLKNSPKSAHMQRAEKLALSTRIKTERTPHPNWPASCSETKQRVDLSLVLAHGVCETQPASRALPVPDPQVRLVYRVGLFTAELFSTELNTDTQTHCISAHMTTLSWHTRDLASDPCTGRVRHSSMQPCCKQHARTLRRLSIVWPRAPAPHAVDTHERTRSL